MDWDNFAGSGNWVGSEGIGRRRIRSEAGERSFAQASASSGAKVRPAREANACLRLAGWLERLIQSRGYPAPDSQPSKTPVRRRYDRHSRLLAVRDTVIKCYQVTVLFC